MNRYFLAAIVSSAALLTACGDKAPTGPVSSPAQPGTTASAAASGVVGNPVAAAKAASEAKEAPRAATYDPNLVPASGPKAVTIKLGL